MLAKAKEACETCVVFLQSIPKGLWELLVVWGTDAADLVAGECNQAPTYFRGIYV